MRVDRTWVQVEHAVLATPSKTEEDRVVEDSQKCQNGHQSHAQDSQMQPVYAFNNQCASEE
jgi:hypothetical protein